MQIDTLKYAPVRRKLLPRLHKYYVSTYQILTRDIYEFSIADGFDRNLIIHLIQDVKLTPSFELIQKRYHNRKYYCYRYANTLYPATGEYRNQRRYYQYPDHRIIELAQQLFPPRRPLRLFQQIYTVFFTR